MKIFHHNDSDGKCAGYWVFLSAGVTDAYTNFSNCCVEMDYNKKFPIELIQPNEQVYIVDFSISPDEMRELLTITKDVTWIDHHITAIQKYEGFEHEIRGIRYDGVSGAMLTYCYLHHMTQRGQGDIKSFDISMTEEAPLFTKLIDDWDVWKFDFGDDTRYFQVVFNMYDFKPDSDNWHDLHIDKNVKQMIENGKLITQYRDNWAKTYVKQLGFETEFEGHKCFAMNLGMCNSEYFKSLPEGKYDILISFRFNGDKWTFSLYSTTVDVSVIAKKYGGGGHKGASGFVSEKIPFIKKY